MTSLITSQRGVKVAWIQEMDTYSAYMSKSQYMESYWFSSKSNINIIYNISVVTITITMSVILANFGKYAISDCPFITCQNLHFGKYVRWSCLFVTCQNYHFGKYVRWSCLFVCLSVCLSVCLYGNFIKSQERVSQSSPNLVTSRHLSMIPASSLDKNVGQITRSRGL